MKHTKMVRRTIAAISALTVSLSSAVLVKAEEKGKKKLLIMGDSISAGYGLQEKEKGYYDILAECLDADLTNYAVSGYETKDVLAQLEKADVQAAIKSADIICMSIGSNDLLHPTLEYAETLKASEDEDFQTMLSRLKEEGNIDDITSALTRRLRTPIREAQANIPEIEKQIRALNENAKVIMYTLYNPFDTNRSLNYEGEDYSSSYSLFMDYVNGQEARISSVITELKTVTTVDIGDAFSGHGWVYLRDEINDIHPNSAGHAMFAATTLGVIEGEKKKSREFVRAIAALSDDERKALPVIDKRLLMNYAELFGDANINGELTIEDAKLVLDEHVIVNLTKGKSIITDPDARSSVDVTGDGKINDKDAKKILDYVVMKQIKLNPSWYELTGNPNAPDAPVK